MPLSRNAKIVLGVGVGAAVVIGGVIWYKRRKRARAEAEATSAALVKAAAADGLAVPAGANAVVKKGIELLRLGSITQYQFEALWRQLQFLHPDGKVLTQFRDWFKEHQASEFKKWDDHRTKRGGTTYDWTPQVLEAAKKMAKSK